MTAKTIVNKLLEDYDPDLDPTSPESVSNSIVSFSEDEIKEVVDSFLATALFLAPEDSPEELKHGTIYMISPQTRADETADITQFLEDNADLIRSSQETLAWIGQSLWCSQSGNGGNFAESDELEELDNYVRKNFRHRDRGAVLGDDGKIYLE